MTHTGDTTPDRWEEVRHLFEQALGLPAEQRPAFLDTACGLDRALHQEVTSLLQAFDEPGPFDVIERDLMAPLRTLSEDSTAVGHRAGPYRIIRVLGHGGMGTVYLAERADADFEQRVALKIVHQAAYAPSLHQRFLQERQILARLEHPHIARFLDGGVIEPPGEDLTGLWEPQPYLAMEHVEGHPITAYCDARRLSITDRLRLFQTVCEAVHYAHQHLVVHRDLKPSNILVTATGHVKLLDFGVAKLLTHEEDGDALTRTGLRAMTPEYAAPEQVRGEPITTATDVYGLGVVLYELLTGRRPYYLADRTPAEIERLICNTEPPRLSIAAHHAQAFEHTSDEAHSPDPDEISRLRQTTPHRLQRQLRGDLELIVTKATAKEPLRRYSSAEALMEDIQRHLDHLPVRARGDMTGYRLRKFVQRHQRSVAAALVIMLTLLAGLGGTAWQARRATQQAHLVGIERDRARQVSALLVDLFEHADPREAQGDTLTVFDLLEKGTTQVQTDLADQPDIQTTMLTVLGRAYRNMAQYEQAQPLLEEALHKRRAASTTGPLETAESLLELGILHAEQGRHEAADSLLRGALQIRQEQLGPLHIDVADVHEHLGALLHERGTLDDAGIQYQMALSIRRTHYGAEHPTVAATLSTLASLMRHRGDYDAADSLYRAALDIQRALFDQPHLDVAVTLNNLGVLRYQLADYAGARQYMDEALPIYRHVYGDAHPEVARVLNNLAATVEKQGNLHTAESLYREALAMKRAVLGPDHPSVASTLRNLGLLAQTQGAYDEAERLLREALAMSRSTLSANHPSVGRSFYNLAGLLEDMGDDAAAEAYFHDALATQTQALGPDHPHLAQSAFGFGRLLLKQGRPADAEPHLRRALSIWRAALPADHPDLVAAEGMLGEGLLLLRHFEEAETLLRRHYAGLQAAPDGREDDLQRAAERLVKLYEAWERPTDAARYKQVLKGTPLMSPR